MLMDDELHSAWVNTAALEIAGITNETPDPDYGETRDKTVKPQASCTKQSAFNSRKNCL